MMEDFDELVVLCDACGIVVDAMDGVTDDCLVFCGGYFGNGCGEKYLNGDG